MTTRDTKRRRFALTALIVAILLVTAAIYWPGMHGPFLLDDFANLKPVMQWLQGLDTWRFVMFDNRSGPLGRPVSMATFLLDAAVSHSTNSFPYKLTNLGVHLGCGLAALWLGRKIFRHWDATREAALWPALVLATWWLWLPLSVDTVLYTVQRMAQLAALFMLLALACFMVARERIARGRPSGQVLLWVGVPALTALATLSKENGALALPLALVLEVFLFGPENKPRARSVTLFFCVCIGLPALGAALFVLRDPSFITGGYANRPFTLAQRLLTEPRVLWSYVQTLVVPLGPRMGFFQDNFPVSISFLNPLTTLAAIIAWIAAVAIGWMWRKSNPLFGAGVCFFLVGQSLESGPIGLEIYFEHRNYLPAFGILLAIVSCVIWLWKRLPAPTVAFRHLSKALVVCALALVASVTWGHVQSWRTSATFFTAQASYNPTSPRLQSDLAARAMEAHDLHGALNHISIGEQYSPATEHATATLWRFLAYCAATVSAPSALYTQFVSDARGKVTPFAMNAMGLLATDAERGCKSVDWRLLATIALNWTSKAPMPDTSMEMWRTRYDLARIIAADGDVARARNITHDAWLKSGYNNGIGVFLFQLNAALGDVAACRVVLTRLERAYGGGDERLNEAIVLFRKALADGTIRPASEPTQQ